MSDSVDYEKVTRAIFQTLVDQDQAENISVEHNKQLQGKYLSHQCDVYWKFESAGIEYLTIVECKNWNKRLKQENLLAFRAKLEDLNNPKGVMVTRSGYQKGAVKYAKAHGILLYELFQAPLRPLLTVTEGTFGTMEVTFKPATNRFPPRFFGVWTYIEPQYTNTIYYLDPLWFEEQTKDFPEHVKEELKHLKIVKRLGAITLFDENENENEIGNVLKILMAKAKEMHELKVASEKINHKFTVPTFIKTEHAMLPYIKLNSMVANITITQHEPVEREMRTVGFVNFILRNLQHGTDQVVPIEENKSQKTESSL